MPKMRILGAQQGGHLGVVRDIERRIVGAELGSRRNLPGRSLERRAAQPNSSRCTSDMISCARSLEMSNDIASASSAEDSASATESSTKATAVANRNAVSRARLVRSP